eukprot:32802_2
MRRSRCCCDEEGCPKRGRKGKRERQGQACGGRWPGGAKRGRAERSDSPQRWPQEGGGAQLFPAGKGQDQHLLGDNKEGAGGEEGGAAKQGSRNGRDGGAAPGDQSVQAEGKALVVAPEQHHPAQNRPGDGDQAIAGATTRKGAQGRQKESEAGAQGAACARGGCAHTQGDARQTDHAHPRRVAAGKGAARKVRQEDEESARGVGGPPQARDPRGGGAQELPYQRAHEEAREGVRRNKKLLQRHHLV